MSDYTNIDELLRAEADTVRVSTVMPSRIRRRIRVRQVGAGVALALSIVALSVALPVIRGAEVIPPASDGSKRGTIARGNVDGISWRMVVGSDPVRNAREVVCIETPGQQTCWNPEMGRYGDARVIVDDFRPLDRSIVIVRTPTEEASVTMRLLSGAAYAALWAPLDDDPSGPTYWYRFFPREVEGILEIDGAGAPLLEFRVERRGNRFLSSTKAVKDEFPELEGYPGEKRLVASGSDGGGYSLIRRETDSVVCLHLDGTSRCRPVDAPVEPIRLALAQPLGCTPEDDCGGTRQVVVVVAGEVSEDVARLGIQDDLGTSYVQVGAPAADMYFATEYYGVPGTDVQLIAFDSEERELQRVTLQL